jgi:hypothetical protein
VNDQWSLDTGSCMMKIDQQKARARIAKAHYALACARSMLH